MTSHQHTKDLSENKGYELTYITELGKGAFGSTFICFDPKRKKFEVVKIISTETTSSTQSAVREISILSELAAHPHIIKYYGQYVGQYVEEKNILVEMELGNVGDLTKVARLFPTRFTFPEHILLRLLMQISSALVELKRRKLIHRDIKPENIFVNIDGFNDEEEDGVWKPVEEQDILNNLEKLQFKLGDFGLATTYEFRMAKSKLGTTLYIAPEILEGKLQDGAVDVYSLGRTLVSLLYNPNRYIMLATNATFPLTIQKSLTSVSVQFLYPMLSSTTLDMIHFEPAVRPTPEELLVKSKTLLESRNVLMDEYWSYRTNYANVQRKHEVSTKAPLLPAFLLSCSMQYYFTMQLSRRSPTWNMLLESRSLFQVRMKHEYETATSQGYEQDYASFLTETVIAIAEEHLSLVAANAHQKQNNVLETMVYALDHLVEQNISSDFFEPRLMKHYADLLLRAILVQLSEMVASNSIEGLFKHYYMQEYDELEETFLSFYQCIITRYNEMGSEEIINVRLDFATLVHRLIEAKIKYMTTYDEEEAQETKQLEQEKETQLKEVIEIANNKWTALSVASLMATLDTLYGGSADDTTDIKLRQEDFDTFISAMSFGIKAALQLESSSTEDAEYIRYMQFQIAQALLIPIHFHLRQKAPQSADPYYKKAKAFLKKLFNEVQLEAEGTGSGTTTSSVENSGELRSYELEAMFNMMCLNSLMDQDHHQNRTIMTRFVELAQTAENRERVMQLAEKMRQDKELENLRKQFWFEDEFKLFG